MAELVDPTQIPHSEDVEHVRGVLQWLGYLAGIFGMGWVAHFVAKREAEKVIKHMIGEAITPINSKVSTLTSTLARLEGVPSSLTALQSAMDDMEETCNLFKRCDFVTAEELEKQHTSCITHIWDRLMLDLEKRDRARDQQIHEKMSSICSTLAGIQSELRQINEMKFARDYKASPPLTRE